MEKWKAVVGYKGRYEVSDLGRVRNVRTGHMKKPTPNSRDSRLCVLLHRPGKKARLFKVHRLVLAAFKGKCPKGKEGCHNDGNGQNNVLINLRWDTPTNNHADKIKHGTTNRGERGPNSKLTEKQVEKIRKDKRLQRVIANEYGILQNHVSRIKSGRRWKHSHH